MFYKNITKPIIILFSILSVIIFYRYFYDGTDNVLSSIDGKHYRVRSKKGKEEKAGRIRKEENDGIS